MDDYQVLAQEFDSHQPCSSTLLNNAAFGSYSSGQCKIDDTTNHFATGQKQPLRIQTNVNQLVSCPF